MTNYLPGILLIILGVAWLIGVARLDYRNYDPLVTIHITYNSITDGHSKFTVGDPPREYVVIGTSSDDVLYRCSVSSEFYETVEQNSHVAIPLSKCRVIQP